MNLRRTTPRHIVAKMANIKDKEVILKATRERQSYLSGKLHKAISRFLSRNVIGKKGVI